MALFKILRGSEENLPETKTDGYAYFCSDTGRFFIDYKNFGGALQRKRVNHDDLEAITAKIEAYILNIDYDALLAFDTSEIVFNATTSVLAQAILGQMVLA